MGSIVSLFTGIASTPEVATPQVVTTATTDEDEELGSEESRRKRAEERRRALAQAAGGQSATVKTTPLGSTAKAEVAKSGLSAGDATASVAAQPRKTTLG